MALMEAEKNHFGKNSLRSAACRLRGEINYNGKPVNTRVLRKNSLFIMQEAEFQFFTNSVINELKYGHKDTPEICAEIERFAEKIRHVGVQKPPSLLTFRRADAKADTYACLPVIQTDHYLG